MLVHSFDPFGTEAMASPVQEGWKRNAGFIKGPGIPAPSGQYRVGCVDLMYQLEGDDKGGLLLRLHYPTDATPEAGYSYSLCTPHSRYIKGYYEYQSSKFPGLKASVLSVLTCKLTLLSS